jgi:MFS family permease
MTELTGLIIGLLLTLFIYSYLIGDNPLYRISVHLLVGVSAAYAAVVVVRQLLLPIWQQVEANPTSPDSLFWLVPILFVLLLLARRLPTVSWLGNTSLALLVGIGAAVSLVGSLTGTLWPQIVNVRAATPLQGIIIALLTICTLLAFQFTTLRPRSSGVWQPTIWQRSVTAVGRIVLTITFGALFATLLSTGLILLAERLNFFLTELVQITS